MIMAKTESKLALLTGCTRGLGAAMTFQLIEQGWTVAGCGRNEVLVDGMRARFGDGHSFEIVDVADDDQVREWAEHVLEDYGAPDLVLNNAAIINRGDSLWNIEAEEFDRVIDINIKGVANVIRHVVPAMIERESGVIVNFSSGWGRSVSPEVAPYCATKYAIEGLTQALAAELPRGMAAIPLNPGIINTEMLQSCFGSSAGAYPDADEWAKRCIPQILKFGPEHNGQSLSVG